MVNLGLIGLGEAWDVDYRAALARLKERIRVRAVFDPVFSRAETVASEMDAIAETGLLALARRPDINAILLMETGWHGYESLRMLCSAGKPIFVATDLGADVAMLQATHWTAVSFGLTVMPELACRYTPASSRLQELLATRLGQAEKISVTLSPPIGPDEQASFEHKRRLLINWFDWARYVFRSAPVRLQSEITDDAKRIRIEFSPNKTTGQTPVAEFRLTETPTNAEIEQPDVRCDAGYAVLESPTVIRWENGTDAKTESLTSDRSEIDVMLDHFCRRVVGGLIPVADLSDISRGLELLQAAQDSETHGKPIALSNRVVR